MTAPDKRSDDGGPSASTKRMAQILGCKWVYAPVWQLAVRDWLKENGQ